MADRGHHRTTLIINHNHDHDSIPTRRDLRPSPSPSSVPSPGPDLADAMRRATICWVRQVEQQCRAVLPRRCTVFLATDSEEVRCAVFTIGLCSWHRHQTSSFGSLLASRRVQMPGLDSGQ